MTTPNTRSALRHLAATLLAVATLTATLTGCPSTTVNAPLSGHSALLDALAPIEADLSARRWANAATQAKALAARYPNDPCLGVAHLLHGRAMLGAKAFGDAQVSLRTAQALGCDAEPLIPKVAALYIALTALRRDGVDAGVAALNTLDPLPPVRWMPSADASPLWWLVAERHLRAAGLTSSIPVIPTSLISALSALGQALAAVDPEDTSFAAFLRARAWAIAADAPDIALYELLMGDPSRPPLAAAVAGYTLTLRALSGDADAGTPDPSTLFAAAEPALNAAGEAPRAALLRQLLGQPPALSMSSGPVLIGAVLPLSGPNRKVGRMVMAGLLLAQNTFAPNDTAQTRLIFEDDASQPERAADAVRRLAAAGVVAIVGPLDAEPATAAAAAAAEVSVPLLTFSHAAPLASVPLSPYVTRFAPSPLTEALTLAAHLRDLSNSDAASPLKVLILHPDLPYGEGMASALTQALADQSAATIVASHAYPPDATDLRKLAKELSSLSFDAVFIPDTAERADRVASFLAQENLWSRPEGQGPTGGRGDGRRFVWILGTSLWYQDDFSTLRQLEGAVFPVAYAATEPGAENQAFVSAFQRIYGRPPGLLDALGFDAMNWLRSGLEAGVVGREGIRDMLTRSAQGYEGITGTLTPQAGSISPGFRMVRVKGAKPTFLIPPPPTWTP